MPTPVLAPPPPPAIPTGRELYDALMAHIEPELTSAQAKTLAAKYKNETPENHALRMKRYELAFERCQQSYDEYMQTLDTQVKRYRKEAFTHAEAQDRSQDEDVLAQFGTLFQSSVAA